jgi:CBS domain-containing protein
MRIAYKAYENYYLAKVKIEMSSNVTVKDIMSRDIKTVNNNTSVQEVVEMMNKFDKDAILVIQSGKPTGIITVKDVLIRAVEGGNPLRNIIARMVYTNPLVVIDENASIEEAAKLMKHWNIKHLPVINKEGALLGMINDRDVVYSVPKLMSIMEEFCRKKDK